MIRNYLLISLRNFRRNKNYTLLNVLGLSIGITSCIILFLLIRFDRSFDKFHHQYNRMYRVVREVKTGSGLQHEGVTPYPFANAFRQDFSDVPLATQIHYQEEGFVTVGTEKQEIEKVVFADSVFFKVFDFGVISGNPSKDLGEPNKAFVTEGLAEKLKVTVGSKIKIDNKLDVEVVGLLKNVPPNSHLQYNMVVSMPSFTKQYFGWPVDRWGLNSSGFSYIVLPSRVTPEQVEARLKDFVKKYYDKDEGEQETYRLQPFGEVHFDTRYTEVPGEADNINSTNLLVLAILGFFILLIACVNFVNLATALAIRKSKEIGIRKTLGAKRSQLTVYFLAETLLITLLAVIISLGLVEWILPWLRGFLEKDIRLNLFSDPSLLIFLISLIAIATFFSGFYPALVLSGFDPAVVLKNKINATGSSGSWVRRTLVIFQFVIAQLMIIGTLVVTQQMHYLNSKPLGFNTEAILNIAMPKNDKAILDNFRTRLESNPAIKNVSFAIGAPTAEANIGTGFYLEQNDPKEAYPIGIKTVDIHYKDTYGIKLKAGRWFTEADEKSAIDTTLNSKQRYGVILNETAVHKLGFHALEDALGKNVHVGINDIVAPVIGGNRRLPYQFTA